MNKRLDDIVKEMDTYKKTLKDTCCFCGKEYSYEANILHFIKCKTNLEHCDCEDCQNKILTVECARSRKEDEIFDNLCKECREDYDKLSDLEDEGFELRYSNVKKK